MAANIIKRSGEGKIDSFEKIDRELSDVVKQINDLKHISDPVLEVTGSFSFLGNGSGLPFGHIYSNATIAVVITNTTPVEVGDTFTKGETNLMGFGASHYLTIQKTGRYKIDWGMSLAQNSPSAAIELEGGIMINGVAQLQGATHRTVANATDIGSASSTAILRLVAGDKVSLYVANETNGTDIDVEHANLTAFMVGG